MSFAEDRKRIQEVISRAEAHNLSWRHVVAVLVENNGRALFIRNDEYAPNEPGDLANGFAELSLDVFPQLSLSEYSGPILGLPAIAVLRPEISSDGPRFFHLADFLKTEEARIALGDTQKKLAERLPELAGALGFPPDTDLIQEAGFHARSLWLTTLLDRIAVEGLVALVPGPGLSHCIRQSQLFYLEGTEKLPEGIFTTCIVHTGSDLSPVLDAAEVFIPKLLLAFLPDTTQAADLEALIRETGNRSKWTGTISRLSAWLPKQEKLWGRETTSRRLRTSDPRQQVQEWLKTARNQDMPPQVRLEAMEKAYLSAGLTDSSLWAETGVERIRTVLHQELLRLLEELRNSPVSPAYLRILSHWYGGGIRKEDPENDDADPDRTIDACLNPIRSELAELSSDESSALAGRLRNLSQVVDFMAALERRGVGPLMRREMYKMVDLRKHIDTGTLTIAGAWGDASDFWLDNLVRALINLDRLENLAREAESSGGDDIQRRSRLEFIADRMAYSLRWQPHLPHETPLLELLAKALGRIFRRQCIKMSGQPVIEYEFPIRETMMDENCSFTINLVNRSPHLAERVALRLLPAEDYEFQGQNMMVSWPKLRPFEPVQATFDILPRTAGLLKLHFDLAWANQMEGPLNIFAPLQVVPPPDSALPSIRPIYPKGEHLQNPREFQGRQKELELILSHYLGSGRQNFLLRGPRRCGKSSLAEMVRQSLKEEEVRRHFGFPHEWDDRLTSNLPIWISAQSLKGSEIDRDFYRQLLRELKKIVPTADPAIYDRYETESERNAVAAFSQVFEEVVTCLPAPFERVAFFIDEFDTLIPSGMKGFFGSFRSIVDNESRAQWLIVSATGLMDFAHQYSSPLFNLFHSIDLKNFTLEDVRPLVRAPAQGIHFLDEAIHEIYSQTGGNPFVINVLCQAVIDRLYEEKTSIVRRMIVNHAVTNHISKGKNSELQYIWKENKGLARGLLIAISSQNMPYWSIQKIEKTLKADHRLPESVREQADTIYIQAELERLRDQGILAQKGASWEFAIPLIRTWVEATYLHEDVSWWFQNGVRDA